MHICIGKEALGFSPNIQRSKQFPSSSTRPDHDLIQSTYRHVSDHLVTVHVAMRGVLQIVALMFPDPMYPLQKSTTIHAAERMKNMFNLFAERQSHHLAEHCLCHSPHSVNKREAFQQFCKFGGSLGHIRHMRAKLTFRPVHAHLEIANMHRDLVDMTARVMGCAGVELEGFDVEYGKVFLRAQPPKELMGESVRVPEAEMGRAEVCSQCFVSKSAAYSCDSRMSGWCQTADDCLPGLKVSKCIRRDAKLCWKGLSPGLSPQQPRA